MAFEVVAMLIKFIVPILRIQVEHQLNEKLWEQLHVEGLLQLEEEQLNNLRMLDHEQQVEKAFVDRHRRYNKTEFQNKKLELVFQTRFKLMPSKLKLRWVGHYCLIDGNDGTYNLGAQNKEQLS